MLDMKGFINGEIAYVVDVDTVFELLSILQNNSNLRWLSGLNPIQVNPFEGVGVLTDLITIGVIRMSNKIGLGYVEREYFESKNYKVEVFKC